MSFPRVDTRDLNGDPVSLPGDLAGEINLLLIAYQQWQQRQVDTWMPAATALAEAYPPFRVYELPVIRRLSRFGRFFVNQGMRGGIPGRESRARVLTLYLDKEGFNEELEIASEAEITALLVRPDGSIPWRETGPWNDEKGRSLREALQALLPGADAGAQSTQ